MPTSAWRRPVIAVVLVVGAVVLAIALPGLLDDAWLAAGLIIGFLILACVVLAITTVVQAVRALRR